MAKVSSSIKNEPYKIEIKSLTGNVVIADEPVDKGGKDIGFSPKELLASALAACTSATVRMYADRKQWPLDEVKIDIDLERDEVANKTVINRKVQFIGNLDEEQRKRLLAVANACPVHKILTNPIEINTSMTLA
ncbi:MAG TPA: osmotically inducible protein OsmC [Cytophagales bacterium]|jgi:putative redox protein|nr:osmotically inducible protein OsmC [Cytophagales bacterium]